LSLAIAAVRGFAIFKGVFRYVERLAGHDAALRALAELRGRVFDSLAARRSTLRDGDALTRLVADVDAVQDLLLRCLLPACTALLAGVAAVAFSALVHPAAGLVLACGLLVAGLLIPGLVFLAVRRSAESISAQREHLAVRSLDLMEGAADLAAFGATDRAHAHAEDAVVRLGHLERKAASISGAATAAGTVVQALTALAVFLVSSQTGEVSTAVLTLTALVAVEIITPMAVAAHHLTSAIPAARRVSAALAVAPGEPGTRRLPHGPMSVEFLGTQVSYGDACALQGIDLRVERGRRVAVVGASGAGKSTLLAALAGDVEVEGTVLVAGHPPSSYEKRPAAGLAQDAHVFTATVRANLLVARPGASDAELERAAARARFLEVVDGLPAGWETVVGDGGRGLSGGQRQRLLLARALLADPPVLLLDEPGEGLEVDTADAIVRDLLTLPGGTLVLVTHRLAHLDLADEIVVMDAGRIVQRGTHHELAGQAGAYQDLWAAEAL
jgi:ATP-binding cassette subfamily C protein/ATP-binding cassette subfamily C protein CydC